MEEFRIRREDAGTLYAMTLAYDQPQVQTDPKYNKNTFKYGVTMNGTSRILVASEALHNELCKYRQGDEVEVVLEPTGKYGRWVVTKPSSAPPTGPPPGPGTAGAPSAPPSQTGNQDAQPAQPAPQFDPLPAQEPLRPDLEPDAETRKRVYWEDERKAKNSISALVSAVEIVRLGVASAVFDAALKTKIADAHSFCLTLIERKTTNLGQDIDKPPF